MAPSQLINLKSEDGIILSVDPEVAKMSLVLRDMTAICEEAEEGVEGPPIPVNVTGEILQIVLQWCKRNYQKEGAIRDKEVKEARQLEKRGQLLHAITRAANYLNIEGFLDICLNAMANQIKGKSSLELREFFGLLASGAKGEEEDLLCSHSVHLRQIVPEEVWILVKNKLLETKTSSGDLENFANSSPYFRNLLLSKRTSFLFEKVFSLVAPSVWKEEGLQGIPVSEVLELRRVCSYWNVAIIKLVPEKFQHFGQETSSPEAYRIRYSFKETMRNRLRHNEDPRFIGLPVSQFLLHFEHSHPANQTNRKNPFIWGTMEIETHEDYQNGNEYKRHLNNISNLLSKYGNFLHKFEINLGPENISLLPNKLRRWLQCVPNLKKLAVTCDGDDFLERYWLGNYKWKFSKLKHLEKLACYSLPAPIFNRLIRQARQVSSLTILNPNDDNYKFFTFSLPNLKNLKMLWFKGRYLEQLRSSQVQWPLETFRFTLGSISEEDDDQVGIAALFQVVQEKFANTLVTLDLLVDDLSVGEDCLKSGLDLPNLKKFSLICRFIEKEAGLDFLLPMVNNLEIVHLYFNRKSASCGVEDNENENGRRIVQFHGFEENLLESNIWTIFKKLKSIELSIFWGGTRGSVRKSYCREDWLKNNRDA